MRKRISTLSVRSAWCDVTRLVILISISASAAAAQTAAVPPACEGQGHNPTKNVYFGDLHSHTAYSFDAITLSTRNTPEDAFAFAKGTSVPLPPYDEFGKATREHKLDRPLDFLAVTDHSEYFGEVRACFTCKTTKLEEDVENAPCHWVNESLACKSMRFAVAKVSATGEVAGIPLGIWGAQMYSDTPIREPICGDGEPGCQPYTVSVWQDVQAAANQANSPCEFTAFIGYEWTGMPDGANWHRNVIFRNNNVPGLPISYLETGNAYDDSTVMRSPQVLWQNLQEYCIDSTEGCDVLTIPHNPNLSWEGMLPVPTTRKEAEFQSRYERLGEIHQTKGNSECRVGVGTQDELCRHELYSKADLIGDQPVYGPSDYGSPEGSLLSAEKQGFPASPSTGGTFNAFFREVLKAGIFLGESELGVNPYKLGFVGGTDTHNGTPGATEESSYQGHHGVEDSTEELRLSEGDTEHGRLEDNPGGLTAVWAEENTRDSIFDNLRARETYATSGIRPTVRFFGGWDYSSKVCGSPDFATAGYKGGVPMGSDLPAPPAPTALPRFAVMAAADLAGGLDTKLQRIQIVKGWVDDDGALQERVFNVASAPADASYPLVESYVDLNTCEPKATAPGADTLCAIWVDETFDPSQSAFYYARVLENPTCRWSTRQCLSIGGKDNPCWDRLSTPARCDDGDFDAKQCSPPVDPETGEVDLETDVKGAGIVVGLTLQERAWTSAIWYEPSTSSSDSSSSRVR